VPAHLCLIVLANEGDGDSSADPT